MRSHFLTCALNANWTGRGSWVLSLLACLVAGCDEPPRDPFWVEIDASGVTHAFNDGAALSVVPARWTARVTGTVGQVNGEGPDVFGSVDGLEIDDTGRLFVLDGQAQEVRVFGPDGAYLATIGRPGEGPGEFARAAGLNLDRDGELWVWDPGNQRFSEFSADGELLNSLPRAVNGVVFPWRGDFDQAGSMIDWGLDFPEMESGMNPGRATVYYPVRVDLSSGDSDTLPPLTHRAETDYAYRAPFRNSLTYHLSGSGEIWFGETHEYVLYRRTLAGDTTLIISMLTVEPEAVTAEEIDSILALPDPLGEITGERLSADWMPPTKPVLARLATDNSGRLLVFPRLARKPPGTFLHMFDGVTGRYLGEVDLPVPLMLRPPPVALNGELVGVTEGDFDVPVVVRLRLQED